MAKARPGFEATSVDAKLRNPLKSITSTWLLEEPLRPEAARCSSEQLEEIILWAARARGSRLFFRFARCDSDLSVGEA